MWLPILKVTHCGLIISPRSTVHTTKIILLRMEQFTLKYTIEHIRKTKVLQISHSQYNPLFALRHVGNIGRGTDKIQAGDTDLMGQQWVLPQKRASLWLDRISRCSGRERGKGQGYGGPAAHSLSGSWISMATLSNNRHKHGWPEKPIWGSLWVQTALSALWKSLSYPLFKRWFFQNFASWKVSNFLINRAV